MSDTVKEMLGNSLARSTWDRYGSALRTWKTFAVDRKIPWRYFDNRFITEFITRCWKVRNLSHSTVKIYLGILKTLRELMGGLKRGNGSQVEKLLLKGMENTGRKERGVKKGGVPQ
jgi:hypothetical protein